ncbi:MAG: hypothetical protein GF332_01590 [Candidatus Moranbacteria bacterium]|nr:hypothetical protein [Candidatus Moranbacteria bacterium]
MFFLKIKTNNAENENRETERDEMIKILKESGKEVVLIVFHKSKEKIKASDSTPLHLGYKFAINKITKHQ